jgi:hypothetical protein
MLTLNLGAATYYASPTGKASNSGSISAPWDLETALSNAAAGDTVWLRGGTYPGRYNCYASGTSSAPIVYRGYPGEHATIVGGQTQLGAITLQCHDVWFWGFEIYFSDPARVSSQTGSFPTDIQRGPAIEGGPDGVNCKLINMVLHDDWSPFFQAGASGLEVYGSLSYFTGWDAPDRGHGHALYFQNAPSSATKEVLDNILFDTFAEGMQIYASGNNMDNFDIEGNVMVNAGYPSQTTGYTTNLIVGGSSVAPANIVVRNNFTYHDPQGSTAQKDSREFWLGSAGGGCTNATVTGNYFVDVPAATAMTLESGCKPTMTGNTFVGKLDGFTSSQYSNNTYYSQMPTSGTNVFVRPNQFEAGRANVIIYNWDLNAGVAVDLSSVLKSGDNYVIQDAQNFYGAPIAQGTYSGGSVTIPMTGTSIAKVIGNAPIVPQHTSREFGVFVVMTSSSSSTPPPPSDPGPLANGTYMVKNAANSLMLDDPAFSTTSGQQIIEWGSNGGTNQHWKFTSNGKGFYTIENMSSGMYLTDPSGTTVSPSKLVQESASNSNWQLWSVTASGSDYVIVNKGSHLAIDTGSTSTQGTGIALKTQSGAAAQLWSIQ